MSALIPVADALARICQSLHRLPAEQVALADGLGRVLAEDVTARITQPPSALSAMDGYALRAADGRRAPTTLAVVGSAPAGGAYAGVLGPGEAVRIFTGAPLPDGADTIVIQENTQASADGRSVTLLEAAIAGRHVRAAGIDFKTGDAGLSAGRRLGARDIGLAAGMGHAWLKVVRRPRIAILSTGDELVRPGDPIGANQIINSNSLALGAFVSVCGGLAVDLGIAVDDRDAVRDHLRAAKGCDMLITIGGASVGDHDLVQSVLKEEGFDLNFWRVAIRPGKPLIFGHMGHMPVLGLPGNPVSAMICALVFLRPALELLLGLSPGPAFRHRARLGIDLKANGDREDYMRAHLTADGNGVAVVAPSGSQDSSLLSVLAASDCLIVRAPHAPPAKAGEEVDILKLDFGALHI